MAPNFGVLLCRPHFIPDQSLVSLSGTPFVTSCLFNLYVLNDQKGRRSQKQRVFVSGMSRPKWAMVEMIFEVIMIRLPSGHGHAGDRAQ